MILYIIWGLLPFAFLILFMKSSWRRARGTISTSETPTDTLVQLVFTSVALVIAILIDQYMLSTIMELLFFLGIDEWAVRWLIYPAVLLIGGVINQFIKPKEKGISTMPGSRYVR